MMDAMVQFARNALCTVKNFNYLGDTFLYDPEVTAQYYAFPSPLNKTTPLEILIACTQFYAFVSISIAGYAMVSRSGVGKLQMITRLVNLRAAKSTAEEEEKKEKNGGDKKSADSWTASKAQALLNQSLVDESDHATRSAFVGLNVLALGLAFFWLFANSFHVTETNWIGGLWGLIHALTVMEVALVVFLYYMWKDAGRAVRTSKRMEMFADGIAKKGKLSEADAAKLSVEEYGWLVGEWSPFWAEGTSGLVVAEGRMLTKEEEAVASRLDALSKGIGPDVVEGIRRRARRTLLEGYREYVYLVLNSFAFYGYLACIITVYYDNEDLQPEYIRAMLMWMKNGDADWLGNAVGDFAWTVEPVVMLGSPMLLHSMTTEKKKKEKAA